MPRLRGRSKQVFEACCVEIHRMFAGEITEADLACRSVQIARKYGFDTSWTKQHQLDPSVDLIDLVNEEVAADGETQRQTT